VEPFFPPNRLILTLGQGPARAWGLVRGFVLAQGSRVRADVGEF